jgi:tetratricopeptide (TPR) repeat protein
METKPGSTPASVPVATIEHDHSKLERFLEDNAKGLLIALAGIFLAVCAFFVIQFLRSRAESEAARAFTSADTVEALRNAAENHSGKIAAGSALLELADRLWKEDKKDESRETLETFLASYQNHPRRHAAYLALAIQDQAGDNFDKADENLSKAMGSDVPADIDQLARIRLAGLLVARAIHAKQSGDTEATARFVKEADASYDALLGGKLPALYKAQIEDSRRRLNLIAPGVLDEEEDDSSLPSPESDSSASTVESTPEEPARSGEVPPSEAEDPGAVSPDSSGAEPDAEPDVPTREENLPDTPAEADSRSQEDAPSGTEEPPSQDEP